MKRAEQKQEAIQRMKLLKLHENVIQEFDVEGKLNMSESDGSLFWLNETQARYVEKFETKYGGVVYHVIRNFTEFGELLSLLYVSKQREEWDYDRADLEEGYAVVYVVNLDDEICSEFGGIWIKPRFGGLIRTA